MLNKEHATPDPSPERHSYLESDSSFVARSMLPPTPYDKAMFTPCADDSASDAPSEPDDEFMEYVKVLHQRLATNNAAQLRTVCLHCVFATVAWWWPTSLRFSRNTAFSKLSITIRVNKLSFSLSISCSCCLELPTPLAIMQHTEHKLTITVPHGTALMSV